MHVRTAQETERDDWKKAQLIGLSDIMDAVAEGGIEFTCDFETGLHDHLPERRSERMTEQIWDGLVEGCDALSGEGLAQRHAFADAAKLFDWPAVLGFLDSHPRLMNTTRPGGGSWFTPLHQAAYGKASPTVIRELVARGGWLTLEGVDAKLVVSSWCRVSGGSGQRHEITSAGSTLVEEGFV